MLKLDRLAHFAAVVETGSFTRAAERMGVTKAVVSAHVARLEEELGTALLTRTTRQVRPTDAGRVLHERARVILREAEEAESEITQSLAEPRGVLRMTAPNDYGLAVLVPLIAEFRRRYPACRVELDLNDQLADIQSGNWDMAIRLGWPSDSSLKSRRIGTFRQYLVAAPDCHIMDADPLLQPEDLAHLPFIANAALRDAQSWHFSHPQAGERLIRFSPVVSVNTTPALLAAALQGLGLAILPDFLVEGPLREGRLVHHLPSWSLRSGGIHIVYPPVRFRLPKVSAFAELLTRCEIRRADSAEG